MGWIIATVVFGLLWVGSVWFLVTVVANMFRKQVAFEEELEERVDTSLRVLDESFMQIALVANKPVLFDSPEVQAVVRAVQRARDAVVYCVEVMNDISVEDNTDEVTPKPAQPVSSEDPYDPKSADELDRETRNDVIRRAVRSGQMEVLNDPTRTRERPQQQGTSDVTGSGLSSAARVALERHRAKFGTGDGQR